MSANRHLGRIIALQTLYEQDFRRECNDETFDLKAVLARNIKRYKDTVEDQAFINRLVTEIDKRTVELDELLQPIAPDWPMSQIARMDRIVLRIGAFELIYENDTPPRVVINEAVELSKGFGGENSSKFINGVLGTLLKLRGGDPERPEVNASKTIKSKTVKPKKPKKTEESTE